MREFKYEIRDPEGIHARPAGVLVKTVAKASSDVRMKKAGDTRIVNAKSIMGVMSLGVKRGNLITVTAEGEDEAEVIAAVERVLIENL